MTPSELVIIRRFGAEPLVWCGGCEVAGTDLITDLRWHRSDSVTLSDSSSSGERAHSRLRGNESMEPVGWVREIGPI